MIPPDLSSDLTQWAALAGFSLTPDDGTGAAMFWSDPGGEIRYYVRRSTDDTFVLSSAERTLAEQFELSGTSVEIIERYLYGVFGADIRSLRDLPRLALPTKQDQVAEGYALGELDSEGYRSLSNSSGLVAQARGRLSSTSNLTELSHLLSAAVTDIRASFEDPRGCPLSGAR